MKTMKTAFLITLLAALPALAQTPVDVSVFGTWVDAQGETAFEEGLEADFESGTGFGVAVNWFWGERLSTEFAASAVSLDAGLEADVEGDDEDDEFLVNLGSADLTPITATMQFHFARDSRIDPYVGAGVAWVLAGDLESEDLDLLEIGEVEVDDAFTYLLNAGLGIRFTETFGLYLDGKYIPLEPATRAEGDDEDVDIEINPVIFSAGVKFRF